MIIRMSLSFGGSFLKLILLKIPPKSVTLG